MRAAVVYPGQRLTPYGFLGGFGYVDDAGMGSWLSKTINRNKNTIASVAPVVASVAAIVAPVAPWALGIAAAAGAAGQQAAKKVQQEKQRDAVAAGTKRKEIWRRVQPIVANEPREVQQRIIDAINADDTAAWSKIVDSIKKRKGATPASTSSPMLTSSVQAAAAPARPRLYVVTPDKPPASSSTLDTTTLVALGIAALGFAAAAARS